MPPGARGDRPIRSPGRVSYEDPFPAGACAAGVTARPELRYRVFDEFGEFIARLDMGYPQLKLAMEYDGRGHLEAWQHASDARRLNKLDASGWSILRFTAADVLRTPNAMAAQVRDAILRRSRRCLS